MFEFIKRLFGFGRKQYTLRDVFTSSADTSNYIQRKNIEDNLVRHLYRTGPQLVVFGHSGGGKTTLIEYIKRTKGIQMTESFCMANTKIDDLIRDAFDRLELFYKSDKSKSETGKLFSKFKSEYLGNSAEVSAERGFSNSTKQTRIVPVQVTAQRLSGFLGEAKLVWLIDDFHKLDDSEKIIFSQMLKVFSTQSKKYSDLKIICVGAERSAREVIDYDKEMKDRVAEVHVPLMTNDEIKEIVRNGFKLLNAEVEEGLVEIIAKYSSNLPTVAHDLCYHLSYDLGITSTLNKKTLIETTSLNAALEAYVESSKDSYKQTLDKALSQKRKSKYNNGLIIIQSLISLGNSQVTHAELLHEIHKLYPDYPAGNLTTYLPQLCSDKNDEILTYDQDSNKYSFKDPFMYGYSQMVLSSEDVRGTNLDDKPKEVELVLSQKLSRKAIEYILNTTIESLGGL